MFEALLEQIVRGLDSRGIPYMRQEVSYVARLEEILAGLTKP